ncbi:myogenesis-regulating glycosidase-like [Gigantopelta aegis]|uniref:myogenesis-regulating glycosidase-like n=1 Tax=Gigantopelta aegis TaxID=1735272 RepID=UPI001B88E4A8|nr:myogenesis-regulating glycosidase-like [Gigantopelta aegis]XP_041349079.1 myogenesis-regulating glycosidase-like [Gigantopelta aegis]
MTNRKDHDTTDTDTDKSSTHDDSSNQIHAHQENNSVAVGNSSHPSIIDSRPKPDSSHENTTLKPVTDSCESRNLSPLTNDQAVTRIPVPESPTNETSANGDESDVVSSSVPIPVDVVVDDDSTRYLTSELNHGATCSSDTIDSGIYRSSRSLERSESAFEREDTVPELHQQPRLGNDYNYDYRRPSNSTIESLSDDEIEENYLGNIPAHKRRSGVFVCPIQEADDIARNAAATDDCDSYIGVKRIRQDTSSTEDYDNNVAADGNDISSMSFGVKRAQHLKSDQNGDPGSLEKARPERWSLGSMDSMGSKSECSVSFSNSLATHVRKDSIAIGLDKMRPSQTFRRRSSVTFADLEGLINKAKLHKSKKELLQQYRLHIFVAVIFAVTVTFVGIGWFYHSKAVEALVISQKIFFDPRSRKLTLHSQVDGDEVTGYIGLNIPRWQLPLHCQIQEEGNPNAKECLWKHNAMLRINYYKEKSIQCYNISWEYLNPSMDPLDCFEIGNSIWFGSSNLSTNMFPIVGSFSYNPNVYRIKGNGVLSQAVEYYWLSSNSHAIFFHSDIPLHISWNDTHPGRMCLISNYSSPFYTKSEKGTPPFNYTVCNGHDMVETHMFMRSMFSSKSKVAMVNTEMLLNPWWSVHNDNQEISQKDVLDMASNIKKHRLNCSTLDLDGKWQNREGDLDFDPTRFSNTTEMLDFIRGARCNISVSVSPRFDYGSLNFKDGIEKDYFVKDAGGEVPGLTRNHNNGVATVLDVSNPSARAWYASKLGKMASIYGINTFSFSYGNGSWLPHFPHFDEKIMSPNRLRGLYSQMVASVSNKVSMQMMSQSQHVQAFLPIRSLITVRRDRACISNSIPAALTTGLLGYPYVFSDGFQFSKEEEEPHDVVGIPSRDIYIRWLQLSAFFPAMKYSLPPWVYDEATLEVARNMSDLHQQYIYPIIKKHIRKEIKDGMPILRPVWWLSPHNKTAMDISDEFLVGDQILVAPIMCERETSRDIFFPKGIWADITKGGLTVGPRLVKNYTVGQFDVPHFIRMKVTHE